MTTVDNKRDLSIEKDKSDKGGMAAVPSKTRFDPLRDNDANNIFEILDPLKIRSENLLNHQSSINESSRNQEKIRFYLTARKRINTWRELGLMDLDVMGAVGATSGMRQSRSRGQSR